MGGPAAALPLPVGQHQLERAVGGGGLARPVDQHQRLGGGDGRGGRRQRGVARLRHRERAAGAACLRENARPGRVARRLAQVKAAHAGRPTRQHQRPDHPDRLVRRHHQVRHPVPGQLVDNHRVGAAGEHGQVGQPTAVVGGPHLPRHPVHGAGDPGRPLLADVGLAEPARGDVGRGRRPAVRTAHPRDAGRRQKRRDAGADPARAVDPGERGPAAGEHRRPAVAVPVGERGAGQLGGDPLEQVPGQRRPQAGREVIEHPGRGQQAENLIHCLLADAVRGRRPRHLGRIAGPVEQRHDRGRLAQPGQRPGPPRIDPDLQRVAVPPEGAKSRLQCWSHATNRDRRDRHSGPKRDTSPSVDICRLRQRHRLLGSLA
jgi:hypothetical protein